MAKTLVEKSGIQIRLGSYGTASATALADQTVLSRVQDVKRQLSAQMYPIDRSDIQRKVSSADYHVSRKVDGEFTVMIFQDKQIYSVNPGGTVRVGLPWMEETAKLLSKAKIKSAMIAGEFYVSGIADRRARVHDIIKIARQPQSQEALDKLAFAVFDLIEINGDRVEEDYNETWKKIENTFGNGQLVHPVETVLARTISELEKLYEKWVIDEGAEGIIARSDTAGFFKIKPRHTLDAAVIGFTESGNDRGGMLHDLLLAIVRKDSSIQVLGRVGGGFSDDQRRAFLSDLKDMVVDSEYAEVNSDHVAYQMVKPEWVVEISCLDLISQTTRGAPVNRMVLNWNRSSKTYEVIRRLPLVSIISPQFIRIRDDKKVVAADVRIQQIADRVEVPLVDHDATGMKLPKSSLLRREVYTKELKGETMVRKFLMWKTNKENESNEFPAYVVHYTDFSPNRKIPLSRDIRVSSSETQIEFLWAEMKEANIKKGWELYSESTTTKKKTAAKPSSKAVAKKSETASKKKTAKKAVKKKPAKSTKKKSPKKKSKKK